MNHTLSRLYDETVEAIKHRFASEELYMILDVMNGTWLNSGLAGQHVTANVYDSFRLYPGQYEEKWNVNKDALLAKLKAQDQWTLAVIEIWSARFWEFVSGSGGPGFDHKEYCMRGKFSLSAQHGFGMKHLDASIKKMEESRSVTKTPIIAEARAEAEKARTIFEDLI